MLIFIADDKLPRDMLSEIYRVYKEAEVIFGTPSVCLELPVSLTLNRVTTIRETQYGKQKDAKKILSQVRKTLGTEGQSYVVITTCDITHECASRESGYLNFVFGLRSGDDAVISAARLLELPLEERKIVLGGVIMHEIGHIYGAAADPNRANTEENLGTHCTDPYCVMQQGATLGAMRENMLRVADAPKRFLTRRRPCFCKLCRKDIRLTLRHK